MVTWSSERPVLVTLNKFDRVANSFQYGKNYLISWNIYSPYRARARARARNRKKICSYHSMSRRNRYQMQFDHEKLDVYPVSLQFVAWTFKRFSGLTGPNRHPRDQILRASQSITQNIAEGNGKRSIADRKRFFQIARGSALECSSILDIFIACGTIHPEPILNGRQLLLRIVSMLSQMIEKRPVDRND
jgi:four helix bundle protein